MRKGTKNQNRAQVKKKASKQALPSSFSVLGDALKLLKANWRSLVGIMLIYLILNIVFASGLSGVINNFSIVKENLAADNSFSNALSGLGSLLGSGASGDSQSGSALQSVLLVIGSLAIIWALRQLLAKKEFSVKDAYYKSMFPLVPFLLVIFVIIIQLLPITLGSAIVALISSTLASSGTATFIMALALVPLFAWSVYMLSSSVFALYIVTLPDMQPRQALRSAKRLVEFRRLKVIRRLLFLPLFILLAMAVIVLPLILFIDLLVIPVFYLLSILVLLVAHAYLYNLYRGLLDAK
ncbi:hypothetical protein A3J32_02120 [Candidatus Saccharibacteria bacterium RIFCSPLOWO2_02_FULL_46_7]|nr:MAG: hypothetical protein A3J32_02120 [Candidatus Saccharibacteria bacterium RIFCSPLOWO2_02_FULL_46_7]